MVSGNISYATVKRNNVVLQKSRKCLVELLSYGGTLHLNGAKLDDVAAVRTRNLNTKIQKKNFFVALQP